MHTHTCNHTHLQAGAFKIGDTAGTLENIVECKLHRPGSVGFVSKSGGMSNEMYSTLARTTDGLFEGAIVGPEKCHMSDRLMLSVREKVCGLVQ